MADIVLIGGSPSFTSRSAAILTFLQNDLARRHLSTHRIDVRALPAEHLLHANSEGPAIQAAIREISQASAVIIATPVYKAAYTGILKAFLDLLPQRILSDKVVLPMATAGSPGHMLAIDYALKPVLSALGVQHILHGVYILDSHIQQIGDAIQLDAAIAQRMDEAVQYLVASISRKATSTNPRAVYALSGSTSS